MGALSGDVELNPGPNKVCPACNAFLNNKQRVCLCGHVFDKRGRPCTIDKMEVMILCNVKTMQHKRQHESIEEGCQRKEKDQVSTAKIEHSSHLLKLNNVRLIKSS